MEDDDDRPSPPIDNRNTPSQGLPKVPTSQPRLLRTLGTSKSTVTTAADTNPSKTPPFTDSTKRKQPETSRPLTLLGDISRSPETPGGTTVHEKIINPVGYKLHSGLLKFVQSPVEINDLANMSLVNQLPKANLLDDTPHCNQIPDTVLSCQTKPLGSHTFSFNLKGEEWPLSVGKEKVAGVSTFFEEEVRKLPFKPEPIVVTAVQNTGSLDTTPQMSLKSALKTMVDAPVWQPGMFNMSPKKVAFSNTKHVLVYDSSEDPSNIEVVEDVKTKGITIHPKKMKDYKKKGSSLLMKKDSLPLTKSPEEQD